MGLNISIFADRACCKSGTQPVNFVATIINNGASAVTLVNAQVNVGPAGAASARGVPLGSPYANTTIPSLGSISLSFAQSFLNSSPPVGGQTSLPYTVSMSAQASDNSVAVSPVVTIGVYALAPPGSSSAAATLGQQLAFSPPPGGNFPPTPQVGQSWFEDTPNSELLPVLGCGH